MTTTDAGLLGATLVLLVAACAGAVYERRALTSEHGVPQTIDWPLTYSQLLALNPTRPTAADVRAAANPRHKLHCPMCNRFATPVEGFENTINCKVHGLVYRVPATGPIGVITYGRDLDLPDLPSLGKRDVDRLQEGGVDGSGQPERRQLSNVSRDGERAGGDRP